MTRILYWNVKNVGSTSLYPPPNKKVRKGNGESDYAPQMRPQSVQDGRDRVAVFKGVIEAVAPDIVVALEVTTAENSPEGGVVSDDGMRTLYVAMRNQVAADWRLVPPLGTGKRAEGIAVFYRSNNLKFLGPWGMIGVTAAPIPAENPVLNEYVGPWSAGGGWSALPSRAIGEGWPTPNLNENRLAAQWLYTNEAGERIQFPMAGMRAPILTWFGDPEFEGGPRVIKLLSFHAPPGQTGGAAAPSVAGTGRLAQIREMNAEAIAPLEVRCIVGDFNVSAWSEEFDEASYAQLRALGYIQHLNPRGHATEGAPPPPEALEYGWPAAGYYATHGRDVSGKDDAMGANPWVRTGHEGENFQGYPGFGWASRPADQSGEYDAIDGAFTRHGAEAGGAAGFTIINPMTGSPYTEAVVPEPPAGLWTGTLETESLMAAPEVFALPNGVPQWPTLRGYGAQEVFTQWENYGQIRSLSDHLPVVIDV